MNAYQKVTLSFLGILVVFWSLLFISNTTQGFYNYLYSFLFGLIPLFGGAIAMTRASLWGGTKSAVGKTVFFIGLGLFFWGAGESVWSYYNFFLGVAAPYPSLADLGFAPSIFFYGLGAIYLSRVTGAKYGLKNPYAKLFLTVAPLIILLVSYYLLVIVARGGVIIPDNESLLKTLLDIVYPLGDFAALTITIIISGLSFKYLGGKYLYDIISILIGLFFMFVADTIFSYSTTVGTYYNANFGDLLLTFGVFFLTFGVLGFAKIKSLGSTVENKAY